MCKLPGELFPDGQAGMQQPLRTTAETNETRLTCLQARNKQAKLKEHSRAFRCFLLRFAAFCCFTLHCRVFFRVQCTQKSPGFGMLTSAMSMVFTWLLGRISCTCY
jgi:hypothetical protein